MHLTSDWCPSKVTTFAAGNSGPLVTSMKLIASLVFSSRCLSAFACKSETADGFTASTKDNSPSPKKVPSYNYHDVKLNIEFFVLWNVIKRNASSLSDDLKHNIIINF